MARLARLCVAGQLHQALQRGHDGAAVFRDADDYRAFLSALGEAAATHRVAIHAYALLPAEIHLLATPASADGLSLLMQATGRRYVAAFNARHRRRGTLWEGRFRAAVVEAERWLRRCEVCVETAPVQAGLAEEASAYPWSSAAHHVGLTRDRIVASHPLDWLLGNTPFDREVARKMLLQQSLSAAERQAVTHAVHGGWALGSEQFVASIEARTLRRARPSQPGRPAAAEASGAKRGSNLSPI
jgi:putative transposase